MKNEIIDKFRKIKHSLGDVNHVLEDMIKFSDVVQEIELSEIHSFLESYEGDVLEIVPFTESHVKIPYSSKDHRKKIFANEKAKFYCIYYSPLGEILKSEEGRERLFVDNNDIRAEIVIVKDRVFFVVGKMNFVIYSEMIASTLNVIFGYARRTIRTENV